MQGLLNFSGRGLLPVIRQTEAAECGLACLAMVAFYHGRRTDMNSLRRRYPVLHRTLVTGVDRRRARMYVRGHRRSLERLSESPPIVI